MPRPDHVTGPIATLRWTTGQAWRDLKSVYYANTPVWRWLKSGALLFLGFAVWAGAAVLLSVRPDWTWLYLFMAYGFLLIFWGPLTHAVIVPMTLRLRRTASGPVTRLLSRHGGKINLTIFLTLVLILAMVQPGLMMLEFSPPGTENGTDVRASVTCEGPVDGLMTCEVEGDGFDHAVIIADGTVIDRADDPPYRLTFDVDEVDDTTYRVQVRDEDGNSLRTYLQTIPEE